MNRTILKASFLISFLVIGISINCKKPKNDSLKTAELFVELPDYCPTPDAFDIAPDGSLTLSCPNYADKNTPGLLVSISKEGKVSKLAQLPGLTDKGSCTPTGIAYAPDGSLFVCDNQGTNKGRLLRVSFKDNNDVTTEVVAYNINGPNGVRYFDGALFVTTPKLPKFKTEKLTSGVYRFSEHDRDVEINNDSTDTRLIFTTQTQNPERQFGLDGLVFNKKGHLLVGDFGDGTIYQLSLRKSGAVTESSIYAQLPNNAGIDGMVMDDKNTIYVAGFSQNQIFKIDKKRKVSVIAQYSDNNGANGEIDQPADLIIYDGKLIISNFDLMVTKGMINTAHSKPYTLSYIDIE